jgi:hypothetical protein
MLSGVDAGAASGSRLCAVFRGRLLCWGSNASGGIKPGLASVVYEMALAGW